MRKSKESKLVAGSKLGQWTLKKFLKAGGNSFVWTATGPNDETVAIKIPKLPSDPKRVEYATQRFRSEIEALVKLAGVKGVLPILDYSEQESSTDDSIAWFAMPLATPMLDVIQQDSSLITAVQAVHEIALTLSHVHNMGMAHRDIKPENLFQYDGAWHVGDFGLVADIENHSLTLDGNKLGPTFYIAPEMLNNASQHDGRSADVYSLAKLLWKLASGQSFPIPGTLEAGVDALRLSSYTSDRRALELDGLLERATSFFPERRPRMEDFCKELNTWLNPVEGASNQSDLAVFKARVSRLSGDYQHVFQNSQALWHRCKAGQLEAINAFSGLFRNMSQRLVDVGFERIRLSGDGIGLHPEFMDAYATKNPSLVNTFRSEPQARNSYIMKFVMRGGTHNVALTIGVDVCQRTTVHGTLKFPLWEDPVLLTGGFLIDVNTPKRKTNISSLPIYACGYIFHFNNPSEAMSIASLSRDLEENLPSAIERVCNEYELAQQ